MEMLNLNNFKEKKDKKAPITFHLLFLVVFLFEEKKHHSSQRIWQLSFFEHNGSVVNS